VNDAEGLGASLPIGQQTFRGTGIVYAPQSVKPIPNEQQAWQHKSSFPVSVNQALSCTILDRHDLRRGIRSGSISSSQYYPRPATSFDLTVDNVAGLPLHLDERKTLEGEHTSH
jgi:hypothetical protein